MKQMKKTAAILFAVLCMVMLPFARVHAQEDVMIVYAQVPQDWENPCVWAWADDGAGAFDAWPGGAMKADESNPGWYYIYVPRANGANVIINANEGSVQTADYKTDSRDVWIVVKDADTVEVSNEQLTEGELPAYEAVIKVSAKVPEDWLFPSLWAWSAPDGTNVFANWPGQELTAGVDGWYSYEVPAWVNSIIINGNLGEVQTADLSIEAQNVWVVVTDAENVEVFYEKPQEEPAAEDLITVHAKAPSDWLLPSLWAWSAPDGTNVFANWPGQELTEGADGWYTYDIPNWVNSIIINGNLGAVQTADISIEPKDVWVVVTDADTYEVYYEKPENDIIQTETKPREEEKTQPGEPEENLENTDKGGNTGLIAGVAIAGAAVCGAGGVALYKKKKK